MRTPVTTIGLRKTTKARLYKNKAPGQCYDGFIRQLVDLWEKAKEGRVMVEKESRGYILNL